MIHNNFRKLFSQLACGANSSVPTNFTGHINIEGNEISTPFVTTSSLANDERQNPFHYQAIVNAQINSKKRSEIFSETWGGTTYNRAKLFSLLGNSTDDEHDYTLGEFIDDNALTFSTSNNYQGSLTATTTVKNISNASVEFDEIGLFWKQTPSTSVTLNTFLLIKEKLTVPMGIGAGESIAISFNLFGDVTIEEA